VTKLQATRVGKKSGVAFREEEGNPLSQKNTEWTQGGGRNKREPSQVIGTTVTASLFACLFPYLWVTDPYITLDKLHFPVKVLTFLRLINSILFL
jgi:hypothetical protein